MSTVQHRAVIHDPEIKTKGEVRSRMFNQRSQLGPENHTALSCVSVTLFEIGKWREGQDGGRVGSPNHLSPPNYLDNLQIILKIYEFGLRFKERTAGMLQ